MYNIWRLYKLLKTTVNTVSGSGLSTTSQRLAAHREPMLNGPGEAEVALDDPGEACAEGPRGNE